jgi:hypothetical protein
MRRLLVLVSAVIVAAIASNAYAVEVTESNDSTANGVPSTPLNAFIPGESAAAWLSASCTGDIVAAQVYWASQIGGAPAQIEHSITLYNAGPHPTPGAVMINQGGGNAQVVGPTLSDGVMNEFRFLDPPANTTALRVPIVAGQIFVVSLTFINQSSGGAPFVPAPTIDQDGCQPLKNAADVLPGGWLDACPLGVTGDFVIRAVIDCQMTEVPPIPTLSQWGLIAFGMLLLTATAWALRRRQALEEQREVRPRS